jgi:Notch-like protein
MLNNLNVSFILDINECASGPCMYGGTCSNLENAYSCSCTNGYSGKNCQGNIL